MRLNFRLNILILFSLIMFFQRCSSSESEYYKNDEGFVLLKESISPNRQFIYYDYHFDHGGFGYSREFWAITKNTKDNFNLKDYNIPDGYRIIGWTKQNELQIEKWEPYYNKDEDVELKSGSNFMGVKLKIK